MKAAWPCVILNKSQAARFGCFFKLAQHSSIKVLVTSYSVFLIFFSICYLKPESLAKKNSGIFRNFTSAQWDKFCLQTLKLLTAVFFTSIHGRKYNSRALLDFQTVSLSLREVLFAANICSFATSAIKAETSTISN